MSLLTFSDKDAQKIILSEDVLIQSIENFLNRQRNEQHKKGFSYIEPYERLIRVSHDFDFVLEIVKLTRDKRLLEDEVEGYKAEASKIDQLEAEFTEAYNSLVDESRSEKEILDQTKAEYEKLKAENVSLKKKTLELESKIQYGNHLLTNNQKKDLRVLENIHRIELKNDELEAENEILKKKTNELETVCAKYKATLESYQAKDEEVTRRAKLHDVAVAKLRAKEEEFNFLKRDFELLQFQLQQVLVRNTSLTTRLNEDPAINTSFLSELSSFSPTEKYHDKSSFFEEYHSSEEVDKVDEESLKTPGISIDSFQKKALHPEADSKSLSLSSIEKLKKHVTFSANDLQLKLNSTPDFENRGTTDEAFPVNKNTQRPMLSNAVKPPSLRSLHAFDSDSDDDLHLTDKEKKGKDNYEDFFERVLGSKAEKTKLSDFDTLKDFLREDTYYNFLGLPMQPTDEENWSEKLHLAFARLDTEHDFKDELKLAEAFYILHHSLLRSDYDAVLKGFKLLSTGFHASSITLQYPKGRVLFKSSSGNSVRLQFAKKYFILDFETRHIYVLNKRCNSLHEAKKKASTIIPLQNIVKVCKASVGLLHSGSAHVINKDVSKNDIDSIIQVDLRNQKPKHCFVGVGNAEYCREILMAMKVLCKI